MKRIVEDDRYSLRLQAEAGGRCLESLPFHRPAMRPFAC
jgi:hypothetical protein